MTETRRILEAASALSRLLVASRVPHAFYGSIFTAVLANSPQCNVSELQIKLYHVIIPLLQGNLLHRRRWTTSNPPFSSCTRRHWGKRRFCFNPFPVDKQVQTCPSSLMTSVTIMIRLHVTYRRPIPAIEVSGSSAHHPHVLSGIARSKYYLPARRALGV